MIKLQPMKAITNIARFFSAICSPLLMGTYGITLAIWLSYLCYSSDKAKAVVIATTFAATCIIPVIAIFLLSKTGVVKDPTLNERTDRTVPYIITALCYIGTGVYYRFVNAPVWLSMFAIGGAVALIVLTIVNRYWKISGHATGIGGVVAMLYFLMCSGNSPVDIQWEFITGVILAGLVCTSRLVLQRHTLMQVGAGFINGFLCTFLPTWFFSGAHLPSF